MSDSRTATLEFRTAYRLLNVTEVAEWLGISPHTLRYWRHVHRGPRSLSVGGAVRYRASDVEEWLDHAPRREAISP